MRGSYLLGAVSLTLCLYAGAVAADAESSLPARSADITRDYLHTWSTDARAALADVRRLYAERVSFYGRTVTQQQLIAEKARFIRRWPVRHYAVRPGTMQVSCDAKTRRCLVRSVIDWRAESSTRRASSRGSSTFEQGLDFAALRPIIFRESGAVIPQRKLRMRS